MSVCLYLSSNVYVFGMCVYAIVCGGMLMSHRVKMSVTLNSAAGRICICRSRSSRDRNSIDRGCMQWSGWCTSNLRLLE